jgi:hypothetical protein
LRLQNVVDKADYQGGDGRDQESPERHPANDNQKPNDDNFEIQGQPPGMAAQILRRFINSHFNDSPAKQVLLIRHRPACPSHPHRRTTNTSGHCYEFSKRHGDTLVNLSIS